MSVLKSNRSLSQKYNYKNIPIPGGGFVTGFIFHPVTPGILYCRTDIGGLYKYDFKNKKWVPLNDFVTDPGMWETFPLAVALDAHNPSYIYAADGNNETNKIAFSRDYGSHWEYLSVPDRDDCGHSVRIHGNSPSRATGERLCVDPDFPETLYLATLCDGLWKTTDRCRTWKKLNVAMPGKNSETSFSFVKIIKTETGKIIAAAANGQGGSPDGNTRGQSLFLSADLGETFTPVPEEPEPVITGSEDHPGYVAQRAAFSDGYLFVTYAAYNVGRSSWTTFGCDFGMSFDGAVMRYKLSENGAVTETEDITPQVPFEDDGTGRRTGCGFGGIAADRGNPGTLICATITRKPDIIYHSTDYGATWIPILSGLETGKIEFGVSYMRPEYSGGKSSCVHWMSDLEINPFDSDMAFFNTGIGIFETENLTDAIKSKTVTFHTECEGLEETVHLNIYCPPSGDAKLVDIIGDYGGFIFKDLDKPAENTFANADGFRWITAMNADYPDDNPQLIIATPRGNWTGETKGGLIISHNGGKDWKQLCYPHGISGEINTEIVKLTLPNFTSGWAAISADGETIIWTVGNGIKSSCLCRSGDLGASWSHSAVYNFSGKEVLDIPFKVMADRVNPYIFYGFSSNENGARIFVSKDRGATFNQINVPEGFPDVTLSEIDSNQKYEIRVQPRHEGVTYISLREYGLWKLIYDKDANTLSGKRLTEQGDYINRIGFGMPRAPGEPTTLFTSGTVNGIYGFWRSHDDGKTWIRINDDMHQYGDIRSISGDPRIFGRVYIATGSRGLLYGDPVN